MTKDDRWILTARIDPKIRRKVEVAAKKRRWSVNDVIEEALIRFIYEGK